ncbi:class A beta-lactamase [Actinomadura sp. PM05-2]|uniref:Class A beta-lactamase n=1 Tax=Actinomadura parmotrematis TaxID=2864039 RepID=A0ABS7FL79_9ACTN|nr:class A beta-lactamase [Actinomadura parmotrematis]
MTALLAAASTACGAATPAPARPVADRAAVERTPAAPPVNVRKEIHALETSRKTRIGAFAVDTGTGRTAGYHDGERFPSLSTFKAIACAAVLAKARRTDPGLPARVVHWTDTEEVDNSPVTKGHGTAGMTVADLCEAAITQSDNTAGNMILRQIGGPAGLTRYYRSLGDPLSRLDRWETDLNIWRPGEHRDTTTAAAMGRDLRATATGGALTAPDRATLTGWMRATITGGARIKSALPPGWTAGNKTGTGSTYGTANDIAVAWPPTGAPVVIAVFSRRTDPAGTADEEAIAGTARVLLRALGR